MLLTKANKNRARRQKKKSIRLQVWEREEGLCYYCGIDMVKKQTKDMARWMRLRLFTVDHKIPSTRGGDYSLENLVASCAKCNSDKGQLRFEEYLAVIEYRNNNKPME